MGIGSLDVWGQEYGFTMPLSAEDLGCTDASACNYDAQAVAFEYNQPTPFKLRFWMVSYDAGFWTQDVPIVTVNGSQKSTDIISGDDQGGDGDDWHQRETVNVIPAGSGTISIYMDGNGVYARRLDEIELWCNP